MIKDKDEQRLFLKNLLFNLQYKHLTCLGGSSHSPHLYITSLGEIRCRDCGYCYHWRDGSSLDENPWARITGEGEMDAQEIEAALGEDF